MYREKDAIVALELPRHPLVRQLAERTLVSCTDVAGPILVVARPNLARQQRLRRVCRVGVRQQRQDAVGLVSLVEVVQVTTVRRVAVAYVVVVVDTVRRALNS